MKNTLFLKFLSNTFVEHIEIMEILDWQYINAKDLVTLRICTNLSSAWNAISDAKKRVGIRPYGKITYAQFKRSYVANGNGKLLDYRNLFERAFLLIDEEENKNSKEYKVLKKYIDSFHSG